MAWGSNKLHLTYDSIGPASVTYNGVKYFYLKNAQGDVTGLVNASGTQVVSYTYDPWGAPMSTDGTMAVTLGAANPLRYRGYVYDSETGLYYLSSRYYNPVWEGLSMRTAMLPRDRDLPDITCLRTATETLCAIGIPVGCFPAIL